MAPPPRPRRRPLLGNIPEPDELSIPLDLEEAIARMRATPIAEDPYQLPPIQLTPPPKRPAAVPEPPGYIDTLVKQVRGETPTAGSLTGAAGGAAAVGADPEGRRRGILERAFAAADEGTYSGGPVEKGVGRYDKEHEEFNRSLEIGARVAREKGGEEGAEQYVYNLHKQQFGGRVAEVLKASRDHSRRRLAEGSPAEQAAAEGEELARRHLENLRRAAEAGELGEDADTAQRAVDMLSENLGTPKGIARLAVTTGLPMLATAAGTFLGGPVIGAGAGVAARTAATRMWREGVEGEAPDPMVDLTAGVTELLDVPGVAGLRAVGGAIKNPLLRTAALTAGGAIAEGAQESAQAVTEGLLQSGDIPSGLDIASQGLAGALVGGALGPLVGGRTPAGQPTTPTTAAGAPGGAPGQPPVAPGAPPGMPPDAVGYLGSLGYDVTRGPDSWVAALERALQNGDTAAADLINRSLQQTPTVQAAAAGRDMGGGTAPRVDAAIREALTDLQSRLHAAMQTGRFDLASDIQNQIDALMAGGAPPAPTAAPGPRTMGPTPGAAPGAPAPRPTAEPRDMGPITITPSPATAPAATPEAGVQAGAAAATQDLLDQARGEGSELPPEAGVGIVGGDLRGAGAGGVTTPVVPGPSLPPIQPPPAGTAGGSQAFAPPPAPPPPPTEAPLVAAPSSPSPASPTAPAPAAGPTVPDLLKALIRGAQTQEEAGALLSIAGRIQAAFGNNPPVEALDRLREQGLTPAEDDALSAFQLALAGGLPGPETTPEQVAAGMPNAPAAPAPDEGTDAPAPDWLKDNQKVLASTVPPALQDKIEELSAQRKTARQVAKELGLEVDQVRAVRWARKIPSMTINGPAGTSQPNPEFEAWITGRKPATAPAAPAQPQRKRKFRARFDIVSPVQGSRVTRDVDIEAVDEEDARRQVDELIRPEDRANSRLENLQIREAGEAPAEPAQAPAAAEDDETIPGAALRGDFKPGDKVKTKGGQVGVIHEPPFVAGKKGGRGANAIRWRAWVQLPDGKVQPNDLTSLTKVDAEAPAEPAKLDRRNSVWVGRGAKGNVRVIFPDANHKELYVLGQRRTTESDFEQLRQRVQDLAKRLKVPEKDIGKMMTAYRQVVAQGIADLEAKAEWIAPPWTGGTGQVDWEPPAPPQEPPGEPPAEPPAPGPATAGGGTPVRGYVKANEKGAAPGEKWIYREEDPDGQVVSEQMFGRKVDAEARRKRRALELQKNRRELRDKNLHLVERDVAARPPSSFPAHPTEPDTKLIPHPNSGEGTGWNLAIQKEFHEAWLRDGKKPAPLFKMLAAAKRLGAIVHPDWEKEFPGLDQVEATGQRGGALPRPAPAPTAAPPATAPPAGIERDYQRLLAAGRRNKVESIHFPRSTGSTFTTPESRAWTDLLREKGWTTHPAHPTEFRHDNVDGGRTYIEVSAATGKVTIFPSRAADGASILSDPDFTADAVDVLRAEEPETWEEAKQLLYETFNVYVPDADAKKLLAMSRQEALPAEPAPTPDDDREDMRKRAEAAREKELERRRNSEQFAVGDVVYTKSGRQGTVISEQDQLLGVETEDYRGRRRVEKIPNYNLSRTPPDEAVPSGPSLQELRDRALAAAVEELEKLETGQTPDQRNTSLFLAGDHLGRAEALGATREQLAPLRRRLEALGGRTIEDERISDVEGVAVIYRSGMSRMGDLLGGLNWETPIGVDINELTGPAIEQIANAYSQGRAPHIFVDSGAFTAFKKGATQDFDAVVAKYRALVDAINDADVNEETLGERRLVLTMPDVIADQDATLELIGKYGAKIAGLSRNVVLLFPLQTGKMSLEDFRGEVLRHINLIAVKNDDFGLLDRIAWGIPSNAAAAPADQIAEVGDALRASGSKATVHFLGASADWRLAPLLQALGDGLRVTADANRLRALIGRVGSREEALAELLKTEGEAPERPEIDPADDIGAEEDEPPAPPPTPIEDLEPAELGPRSAAALERWLKARKLDPAGEVGQELTRIVVRHRTVMRELNSAENKLDYWLKAKPWAIRGSAAEIKRNRKMARTEVDNATGNYEASVKALRKAVAAIPDAPWRSFFQIAEGRIPEPRQQKGAPGPLLPRTVAFIAGMKDAPIDHPIDFDTLEARVIEYAKTAVVSEAAIITNLEAAVGRMRPGDDWKKMFAEGVDGVGEKTAQDAMTAGPTHPAWKKIVAYQVRSTAERRAIEEALSEDGWPLADGGLAGHLGTVAAAMASEIEALAPREDPELPWGLTDPATGEPVKARAALAALQAKKGRLYARIVQALEDSLVGQEVDEVPFDIPEGNPDDIPPFETGEDATEGYLREGAREGRQDGRTTRLLRLLGFRAGEDGPKPRPSILNMPLGKPLIRAAQQTLDFGPPQVHTPVREPQGAPAGSQPVSAGPRAGGRGGPAPGRAETPQPGVRGPGAGEAGRPAGGGGSAPQPTGGVVPTVSRGDDIFKIVTIRPNFTLELPIRRELVPARLLPHLDDHQQIGVARAIEAMSSDQRGFLLADGTGVGKTREILATAEHFAKLGRSVLIVAPAAVLNIPKSGPAKGQATGSYADDSRTMGVALEQIRLTAKTDKGPELQAGKIYLTHYESFFYKNQVDDNTVVIFDEAHNIKNPPDMSRRGGEGQKFAAKAHAVLLATATPGDQAHHLMYAQRIGLLEGRTEKQFLADMGMVQQTRMKADGTTFTVWKARDEIVMRRAIKELYGRLTKAGKMIRREVDFSPVEVEFRELPVSTERAEEIDKIHAAFPSESAFDVRMYLSHARRQLEPDKIQTTLDIMDRELAAGRSVVIFAQRLNRSDVIKRTKYRDEEGNIQVLEELITSTEGTIKTLREALAARGLAYAEITGDFADRKDDQIQLFQSGKARVAIATVEGGGTGINLDDRLGTRPRTLIMMTAPLESTVYIQAIGRVHRKPTKSRSRVIGLFSDHEVDTWNKQIIADKLQLQGAQVAGSVTRLDPTRGGDVDVDFGEDVEVLRPGSRRKPTDDGNTQPQQKHDLALVLSSLKNLVTYNGRYQNPKRLWKESAYRIHRRAVTDLGGVIDIGGEWFIETKDGWVVRGKLTHPNERQGTYGTFEFDQGAKAGVPSRFGVETDDQDIRLVRDVDKLIELIPQYKTWRNFHREHRETLRNLFGDDAPLFARLLGATSQRASVEVNITLALRAYEQIRTGRPFVGFQPQVIRNLEAIREDEALAGSKIAPYTQALMGDEDATWVDRHIGRLVLGREALGGPGQDRVSERQGRTVRAVLRQAASELGWTPAQMSSASWAAGQVLEGGVREENIRDYSRSLQARATAIRRFYDYFGPVAGPGRRPLLVRAASPAEPRNLGFGTSDGRTEPEHRASAATQEEALRAVDSALTELPAPHAVAIGTGFTARDSESWDLWWTALAANFNDQGGGPAWTIRWSDYSGMDVSTPSHIASIANIARNTALEQASVVLVKGGKLHGSLLSGSGLPGETQPLPPGWTLEDLRMLVRQTGSDGYYLVHNHPDGNARPSRGDILATAEIAAAVPGFMGHVVVNHGTYQIITPAKTHAIIVAQREAQRRRSAAFAERALMNVFDQLQEEFAHSVGSTRGPDPMLAAGMDPEDYWRSEKFRIKGVDPLVQKFNGLLLSLSRGSRAAKWPMIVLVDNRWRLRAVTSVNPEIYFDRAAFTTWLDARKRDFGAHYAFVAIEQTVGGTEVVGFGSPEGWGETNKTATFDDTTRDYVWSMVLMGAVDPEAAAAQKAKATIENTIGTRFAVRGFGVEPDRGGTPPPEPPRPPGDDPDDPGWRRRVTFADARARAGGAWTISRLTDALVAGVDRFLRGLKDFARWAASMNYAGLGPYLRAIWARIQEMFRPRAYTQEGRPRSLADSPIEDQTPGPGGRTVIRPIPRVRPEDLQAAVDRVAEGRREEPRIAPARGPNGQPGERPPAPPGSPINLDRVEDQDDIKNLMRQIMEALRARFQTVKSYRSWEEVRALAEEAGLTEQDVARLLRENGVLTDVQIEAIRMIRQDALIDAAQKLAYVQDVRARLAAAPSDQARTALEEELLEADRNYRAALSRGIGIMFTTVAAGSEAGRALAIHRRLIEAMTPGERFMRRLLRGIPQDERFSRELADAVMRNDLREAMRLYHKIHKPTFWGYFNEYFINSILSGPATLIANVAGNVTHEGLLRTPERGMASFLEERGIRAMVERFFGVAEPEGPQRVSGEMREAAKALMKLRLGFPDMWREFRLALTEENIPLYSQGDWSPPAWPGVLGTVIRTPGRLMKALDVASKKAAASAERAAQVYRLAVADARAGRIGTTETRRTGTGTSSTNTVTEEDLRAHVLRIDNDLQTWLELDRQRQANPRLLTTEDYNFLTRNRHLAAVVKAMIAAADKSTFQDDVLPLTRMLMTARARHPWLTPIVPFIKTPERILVAAVKRTPMGLVQALNAMRTGALRGGEASDRIAQGVLGTVASIVFYEMAKEGLLTGGGPSDPKERQMWLATGKLPYAIRIGKTWYSLARIEPLATTLGFAADLAEAGDAKTQGDAWDKLHYSILNNITNKTYLEGMINAAEALSDPDRYGAQFSKRMVGSLVPNLLASAARAVDPTIRQTDDIASTLMARVPILSEALPAKLTGTGEPRLRPENPLSRFVSPIRYSEEGGPERNLERIFLETGYSPSAPPRAVRLPGSGGREFMLDAREREIYGEYARRATSFARQLARNADWSGLDAYQKEEVLKRIYRFAHDSARRDIYRSVYQRAWAGKAEEKPR